MIVKEFEQQDRSVFFALCKDFYSSLATFRGYSDDITGKTFNRVLDRHENLWGFLLIDRENSEAVGYALITSYWCNEEGGEVIILDELFISPNNRKKGYAKLFIQWLEARFCDSAAITLEVLTSNLNACNLYEKAGYRPDGYTTYTKSIKPPVRMLNDSLQNENSTVKDPKNV